MTAVQDETPASGGTSPVTHTVTAHGEHVDCGEDQRILDAFLRAGIWLPNSCNQGTCGTCKVKVLRGSVEQGCEPSETLTEAERADGFALACQASPREELDIEPVNPDGTPLTAELGHTHPLRDLTGTVTGVENVARDTVLIRLELPEPLAFSAGQYVELVKPGCRTRRQYSMANAPGPDGTGTELELHIRRVPGGVATDGWIFGGLNVGDQVDVTGPLGDFHLPAEEADDDAPMVLIGGGTGLAPLVAIAIEALRREPERQIRLYHGVREAADLYAVAQLRALEAMYTGFTYLSVTSDSPGGDHQGFPTDVFIEDVKSAKGMSGWLCGPPAMVDAGVKAFKRRRMAPRQINREKFTPAS